MLDTAKADRPYEIPSIVTPVDRLELLYPIRVEFGKQRVPVLSCWPWLRQLKRDSFVYAILNGRGGWEDQKRFLDSITEQSPVPTLSLLATRDATVDTECIHLILLFKLIHARALDADSVVTPAELRVQPDYTPRAVTLTEQMTIQELIHVFSLADQYGV